MRWLIRHTVFALCFSLGTSVWYILAQQESTPAPPVQAAVEVSSSETNIQPDVEQPKETIGQSIRLVAGEPLSGYANTKMLILRESANADSPVTAKVKMGDSEWVQILDATRDFLYVKIAADDGANNGGVVRKRDYEGWTAWGSVVPELTAIVLDAESGEVVSRVPLDDGLESVGYSPDGSKAIFFSGYNSGRIAREVRATDYTLTRTLTSSGGDLFGMPFYSPDGGSLYATVYQKESTNFTKISLIGIGPDGEPNTPTGISFEEATFFTISPDGSVGFITRGQSGNDYEMTIDVMEMATLRLRNTFTLTGTKLLSEPSNFVLNKDGSELYVSPSEKAGTVWVIDTWTGQLVRELPEPTEGGYPYFSQRNLVGNSMLFTVWEDGARSRKLWVDADGHVTAERGIDYAVEAGGRRYAINERATRLFKLDTNNRIAERFTIARPELHGGKTTGDDLSIYNFIASPDGKRLIIIVGVVHGC